METELKTLGMRAPVFEARFAPLEKSEPAFEHNRMMLGPGVDVPMLVILFGALGGMASAGIMGMFVGATALALGYNIFMHWISAHPGADRTLPENRQAKSAIPGSVL